MEQLVFLAQGTNLNLGRFRFEQQAGGTATQILLFALLVVVLVAIGLAVALYLRRRGQAAELNAQREEARLRLMLSELNLGDTARSLLETLAGSDRPADLVPLLETRAAFEEAAREFRTREPRHALVRRLPQLRQRLDYGFNNIRNPFVDTRMLAPGTRMRCTISLPKGDVRFLTTVLALSEEQFVIRPPHARGRPVSIKGVKRLGFRVSRENDAEYEFTATVLGQMESDMKAIRLAHARAINRLLFRHAERLDVDLPAHFYVIRHEFAGDRATGHRAEDSQYTFTGRLKDISIGGALVLTDAPQDRLNEGDMVVFRLPDTQIRDDLAGMVVGALDRDDNHSQVHLQFMGLRELNRLKLNKYLEALRQGTAPRTGTLPAEAPGGERPASGGT